MRIFKLSLIFLITASFLTACNKLQDETYNEPYQVGTVRSGPGYEYDTNLGRENLDLQAVGELLERAKTPEEFEYMLNDPEYGVNNLDLNDDGYADYISVREFDDRYGDERGFSLFDMFGSNLIQEIATIIFDRNGYNNGYNNGYYYPGSRVLIRGNDYLYGDNNYYETNWLDRSVPLITWAFSDRDGYYNSPYYYENYPNYYEPYQIVETPVYRTRIEQYYVQPVFVQTTQPTITDIKIVSPYKDKSLNKDYSKLPKLPREQADFRNNNPGPPDFVREKQEKMKDFSVKEEKQLRENPNKFEKQENVKQERQQMREWREKPNKQERVNVQPQNPVRYERQNQQRIERQNQMQVERQNQMRVERQNQIQIQRQNQQKIERQNQMRVERQQPQQMRIERPQPQMRPQKQENRPQPNGNGSGGGNNRGGGGGGKGKGKP